MSDAVIEASSPAPVGDPVFAPVAGPSPKDDDDNVADHCFTGGRTVQTDLSGAALALDHVRIESLAVVDVQNVNILVLDQSGGIHQVFIDGDAANIVEIGFGYLDAVYFGFQYSDHHSGLQTYGLQRIRPNLVNR